MVFEKSSEQSLRLEIWIKRRNDADRKESASSQLKRFYMYKVHISQVHISHKPAACETMGFVAQCPWEFLLTIVMYVNIVKF